MRLETEFIRLPLEVDAERLRAEVETFAEADWRPHPQGHPGNSALPLIARGGDPADDGVAGAMLPTPHLERTPYVRQVLEALGAVIGRSRLMRLDGNAEATMHVDTNYYWADRVRVHIPIVTDPAIEFICGERSLHMAPGRGLDLRRLAPPQRAQPDRRAPHPSRRRHRRLSRVLGDGRERDATLRRSGPGVRATAGRVAAGRGRGSGDGAEQPAGRDEPMGAGAPRRRAAGRGSGRAGEDAARAALEAAVSQLRLDWRDAWARHGEDAAGWPAYRELLDRFAAEIAPLKGELELPNRTDATRIAHQMLITPALNPELASGSRRRRHRGARRRSRRGSGAS